MESLYSIIIILLLLKVVGHKHTNDITVTKTISAIQHR